MKQGESFDPVYATRQMRCYPVDVIDARADISDGPKRLYAKLFRIAVTADRRKNPWPGYVYASEEYLAGLMGKSISGVRRDAVWLRTLQLLGVERPNRRGNNQYSFLWHPDFDRAKMSGQVARTEQDDRSDLRGQDCHDCANMSAQTCVDRANVSGRDRADVSGLYKEDPRVYTNAQEPQDGVRRGFSEFQASYPAAKREIKVDSACRAYLSVIADRPGEHERLMEGLARYKASAEWHRYASRNELQYFPSMERFITDRRYLDNPPAADEVGDEDYRLVDEDFHLEEVIR